MIRYLGGRCAKCSTRSDLHFDHIDPKTKKFDVSKNWSISWDRLVVELNKCQLLCGTHHREKTKKNKEHAGGHNKWTEIQHGTVWGYSKYKCRCVKCKAAKAADYQSRKRPGI